MLNGIGGRTIAEAKQRMSYDEAADWALYIRETGGLNRGERMEQGFALVAMLLARMMGNKQSKLEDFIPQRVEQEATIEAVLGVLKAAQKRG